MSIDIVCMPGGVEVKNSIWFPNILCNALFKMDIEELKINFVGMFPNEKPRKVNLYQDCYVYGNEIVFIPWRAKEVCLYNMSTNEMQSFTINDRDGKQVSGFNISFQKKEYVYLVSVLRPIIVRINMINKDIKTYEDWFYQYLKKYPQFNYVDFLWMDIYEDNELLYLPCRSNNTIIELNLLNGVMRLINLGSEIEGIYTLCKVGDRFCISTDKGEIYIGYLDSKSNNKMEKLHFVGCVEGGFSKSIAAYGYVWFFPRQAHDVYRLSLSDDVVIGMLGEKLSLDRLDNIVLRTYAQSVENECYMVKKWRDKYYFMLNDGFLYFLYDGKITKQRQLFCGTRIEPLMMLNQEEGEEYFVEQKEYKAKRDILENSLFTFMELIKTSRITAAGNEKNNCGRNIYESIIDWGV